MHLKHLVELTCYGHADRVSYDWTTCECQAVVICELGWVVL
jgi:hypothetical protein